ncbi:MAG: DivIVA domain-containing protein [Candidatus Zixiibacteriota bacterium]
MSLTPNDIRSYEFSSQMRGYDKEEVDNLLEQIAQEFEQLKQEHVKISMELDSLRIQVSNLKQNEEIIKSAAIDARRNADQTMNGAKKEAQVLLARAKEEIDKMNALKKKKIDEIEQHVRRVEGNRKNYLAKLRTLISSHLDLVEKESVSELKEAVAPAPGDIRVTESKDITHGKMETIGGQVQEDKTDVPMDLRTTVHGDSLEEPDRVEESDVSLDDALRKYKQVKEVHPQFVKDKDEDRPEPVPSLASPKKKWAETTTRAEEVPPGFITKGHEEPPAPSRKPSESQSMEPNPMLMEELEASQPPPPAKTNRTGKVDVAKEFDEIAAKFNEEMDKAENKRK